MTLKMKSKLPQGVASRPSFEFCCDELKAKVHLLRSKSANYVCCRQNFHLFLLLSGSRAEITYSIGDLFCFSSIGLCIKKSNRISFDVIETERLMNFHFVA